MKKLSEYTLLSDMTNFGTVQRPVYLISMIDKVNKTGKTQVMLTVKDGSNAAETKTITIFDTTVSNLQAQYPFMKEGKLVGLNITFKDPYYNATTEVYEVTEEFDLSEVADVAVDNPEKWYSYILKRVEDASMKKGNSEFDPLSKLVKAIYEKNKERLLRSSSAVAVHHTGISGNIMHTGEVIHICEHLLNTWLGKDIDAEILMAAAALHDVGKIEAYVTDEVGTASMTLEGIAMGGHHWDSLCMVEEERKNGNYDPEALILLKNAIASHHGSRDFGDFAEPISLEAVWLNIADDLSAKHYGIKKAIKALDPGTLSAKNVYPYEHRLYRRKNQWIEEQ